MLWNEAISALRRSSAHFSAYLVEVAEKKTDSCHASSKTQTENEKGEREREKCYIFTLDANWKTTLSCQPEN